MTAEERRGHVPGEKGCLGPGFTLETPVKGFPASPVPGAPAAAKRPVWPVAAPRTANPSWALLPLHKTCQAPTRLASRGGQCPALGPRTTLGWLLQLRDPVPT